MEFSDSQLRRPHHHHYLHYRYHQMHLSRWDLPRSLRLSSRRAVAQFCTVGVPVVACGQAGVGASCARREAADCS